MLFCQDTIAAPMQSSHLVLRRCGWKQDVMSVSKKVTEYVLIMTRKSR